MTSVHTICQSQNGSQLQHANIIFSVERCFQFRQLRHIMPCIVFDRISNNTLLLFRQSDKFCRTNNSAAVICTTKHIDILAAVMQKNAVALIQSCSLFDAVKYCQGCFFDILRMLFVALISGCHCPCIRNNIFSKIMRRFNLFLPFRIIHDHTVTQITACRPYLLCT